MARYKDRRHRLYNRQSIGHEKALEHIREAKALSKDLGGTDEDVKKYFFTLTSHQLQQILDRYEDKYGKVAREYAEKTYPKWQNGKVHMSGMVAERLFNLLPPIMPLEAKFQLTESLWKHVGPSSTKNYYIGIDVDLEELCQRVKKYLETVVIDYKIPNSMETRFNWLAQGDVAIKQKLLNHFRQQDKLLLSEAMRTELPILIKHLSSDKGSLTTHIRQVLKIGKHEVRIVFNEGVNGISETAPSLPVESGNYWIWWVVGIIFVLWMLSK